VVGVDANQAAIATAQKRINGSVEKVYAKVRSSGAGGDKETNLWANQRFICDLLMPCIL